MKRALKFALSAVLGAGIVGNAFAQSDNFPDTPENHWAFEALHNLKAAGILVGYPDGLFRGNRPASRYELAVAINAAYMNMKSVTDGLSGQIAAIQEQIKGMEKGGVSQADIQNLRDMVASLSNEVKGMKSYGDEIKSLRRLLETFQKELQNLGVDIEAMKRDLTQLEDRVSKLEKRKAAVDISGDINVLMLAGNSRDGRFGLNRDGFLTGVDPGRGRGPAGMTKDLSILHEGALTFAGTNDTGPKWKGTLVLGNMLDTFGGQSGLLPGTGYAQGSSDVYLQDFTVKFDTSIAGLAFNAEAGRIGYKVSPYLFQRIDNTSYFANERWDNGLYHFDGALVGFNLGSTKLDVFAGNTSKVDSVNRVAVNTFQSGPLNGTFGAYPALVFDRMLGANLNVPLTTKGNLNVAYILLDSTNGIPVDGTGANRLAIYGADLKFNLGKIDIGGGYGKTDLQQDSLIVSNNNNTAWHVDGRYDGNKWNVMAGYREVEANYLAPGDWGRLGIVRNPTNVKGFNVAANFDLTSEISLNAGGAWDSGKNSDFGGTTGLNTSTKINTWNVGATWRTNKNLSLMLGYHDTQFKDLNRAVVTNNPGNTTASYKWLSFGIGYELSSASKLMMQYELSDISNDFQVVRGGGGRFTGGLLSTQLSVKF